MGTPGYVAPEQARGMWQIVDQRTDIWAVGATMFTLLTGRSLHPAQTNNERFAAAMTQHVPSLSTAAPDLSPGLVALVDRALAFEQYDRWPDAASMQQALRLVYQDEIDSGSASATTSLKLPNFPLLPATEPLPIAYAVRDDVIELPKTAPIDVGIPVAQGAPSHREAPPRTLIGASTTKVSSSRAAALAFAGSVVVVLITLVLTASWRRAHDLDSARGVTSRTPSADTKPSIKSFPTEVPLSSEVPVSSSISDPLVQPTTLPPEHRPTAVPVVPGKNTAAPLPLRRPAVSPTQTSPLLFKDPG
jgi:serine/threonine protein kinase